MEATSLPFDAPVLMLLLAVVAASFLHFVFSSLFAPKKPWPCVPGALPLLGNSMDFKYIVSELRQFIIQYGNVPSNTTGLLEVKIFHTSLLLVCNNEIASEIAKLRPNKITRPKEEVEAVKSVGADGVFSAHGKIWAKDRRVMAPPLNQKNLRDYLPFIRTVTQRLIQKWKDASAQGTAPVTINQDLLLFTIDAIGLIAFDQDFDCLRKESPGEAQDLRSLFRNMNNRGLSPVWYWRIPLIGPYLDGGGYISDRLLSYLQKIIDSFESKGSQNGETKRSKTYLAKVLSQRDSEAEGMSHQRVMGNLLTMFIAGSETTGNTTQIGVWELLQSGRESLLKELVEEVDNLPTNVEEASFDELFEGLPKLRAFFYEVNRLNGTATCMFLEAAVPVTLGGIEVPAGTGFSIDSAYLSTLEGSGVPDGPNGEGPGEFCPQRWLSRDDNGNNRWAVTKPSTKTGIKAGAGFGTGVRICPGQDLAELEVIYCLACLLKHFDMSLKPDHPPVKLMTSFTETPDIDIQIMFKPRSY